MIHSVLEYMRSRQTPGIRYFHVIVFLLVLSQILVSNLIGFTSTGEVSRNTLQFYGTWTHICTGITLLPITIIFAFLLLKEHGFKYFYPYIFGDFNQLKSDITNLKKIKLPDAEAGGLAAIVEGLGLGAVFLALLSGLTWFLSWKYNAPWASDIKGLHGALVGLVVAYVVGHGCMGLLHVYLFSKKS